MPGDSQHAQSWADLSELSDSSLVSQPTSVRSASARVKSVATPNLPVAVVLPERSAGWCRCSGSLAVVTPAGVVGLESQVPYMSGTDQVRPLPPPIHTQVSTVPTRKA